MKRYFYISMAAVITFAVLFIGYGVYLNKISENVIQEKMGNRVLKVMGAKAAFREIIAVNERRGLTLYSEHMADAVARVEGTVSKLYVKNSQSVKKGQIICEIINETLPLKLAQIDSKLAKAEAGYIKNKRYYERIQSLGGQDAISQVKLDEVSADVKVSQAEIEQLKAERDELLVSQGQQVIRAPLDGEVLMLYAREGGFISAGTPVTTVGNFDVLYFREAITDKALNNLVPLASGHEIVFAGSVFHKGYDTNFKGNDDGWTQPFVVRIVDVQPPPEIPATMRNVTWEIDNHTGLLAAGLYKGAKIYTNAKKHVLTIPKLALRDGNYNEIYVKNVDGVIEERNIQTGIEEENYIEVKSGLQDGEIVIISGRDGLQPGMKIEVGLDEGEAK